MFKIWKYLSAEEGGDGGQGGSGGGSGESGGGGAAIESGFDFRSVLDGKGAFVDKWQDRLPTEYDPYKATLANFNTFDGMTKALADNMKAARSKTEGFVKVPGEGATPEEIAMFRKGLGVPEKPEDYGLKAPEKLPPGVQFDEKTASEFSKLAHELGLTKAQVAKLSDWQVQQLGGQTSKTQQEQQAFIDGEKAKIQQAFGSNLEKRMVDAKRAAMTLGLDPESPLFQTSEMVIAMAKFTDMVSEDKLVSSSAAEKNLTPSTAATDIISNKDNPDYAAYHDPGHGRHTEVVARVNDLMKRAYPGGRK